MNIAAAEKVGDELAIDSSAAVLKIAVLAVGGQGGGVLANWIAELAKRGGFAVQMTSVAGVAQRTGATIYYLEMAPKAERDPVLALTPTPGDVDIVIAAELMEAGRAVLRNFVSPERTTLIASTHRILAVNEKQAPADGRADAALVLDQIEANSRKLIGFDMETIAKQSGSVISASLFGALAKSQATPFPVAQFEEVVRDSGRGVAASLAAFRAALNYEESHPAESTARVNVSGPKNLMLAWNRLAEQVDTFPLPARSMILAGLRKVVDYQDVDYGGEYLDKLNQFRQFESDTSGQELIEQAAKYIANAMCYDDLIRVADLKTRASRNIRLRREQQARADQIVQVTEYFHPRAEEVCGAMPASLGAWFERHPKAFARLDRLVNKSRRIRTDRITGFTLLWIVGSMKPLRRKLLRHRQENTHIERLLQTSLHTAATSIPLAIEVLKCQRLVKGYADTHQRGQSKFQKVIAALSEVEKRTDAAACLKKLRQAALVEASSQALDKALDRLRETV